MRCPDIAEQAATALLLRQRLYSLRIDPRRLSHDRAIRFDTFQDYCALTRMTVKELASCGDTKDGLTLRLNRGGAVTYVVLYHGGMERNPRLRFTLAHELGHIYLDHPQDGDRQEREANRFAAQLLLPRVLAGQLAGRSGGVTPEELAETFGVSRAVAEYRLRSLRSPVNPSEEDLALLKKLGGFLPEEQGPLLSF